MADDKKNPPTGSTPKKKSPKEKPEKEMSPTPSGSTPKKKSPKEKYSEVKVKVKTACKDLTSAIISKARQLSPRRSKSEDKQLLTLDEGQPSDSPRRTSRRDRTRSTDGDAVSNPSNQLNVPPRVWNVQWKEPQRDPESGKEIGRDHSADSRRTQGTAISSDGPSGASLDEKEEKDDDEDDGARGGKKD